MNTYYVSSGQTSTGITLVQSDFMYVRGGTANRTTVNSSGYMRVSSGGTANNTTVNAGAYLLVSDGGKADSTIVKSDGYVWVYSGASADRTSVNVGGRLVVSGGTANSTTVNSDGYVWMSIDGTANNTVLSGGKLIVNDATANGTIVNSDGYMWISGKASAARTTVNSGGGLSVSSGAMAVSTTINSGGSIYLHDGGTAQSITLEKFGSARVYGGLISDADVGSRAYLLMYSAGSADDLTIGSGGRVYLKGNNTLGNTVISRGGILLAVGQASLSGDVTLRGEIRTTDRSTSGTINAQNHKITLDLQSRVTEEIAFIDDLSRLSNFNLTVSVSNTQRSGVYHLAGGAESFAGTITVCSENGTCRSLTVGGSAVIGNQTFSLNVADSLLDLTVSNGGTQKAAIPEEYVPGTWSTDWVQASDYAKKHNMKIFAHYGDLTWCGYCGYMNSQLFGAEDFQRLSKSVVLLYDTPVPGKSYSGAPVGYILDPDGNQLAVRAGFGSGSHDAWMTWLKMQLEQTSGIIVFFESDYNNLGTSRSGLVISGGTSAYVLSANLNSAQVASSGYLYVLNRGGIRSTTAVSGGRIYVSSGGTASGATVNDSGYLTVSSSGVIRDTTVNSGGRIYISSGGTAVDPKINASGYAYVVSGGMASGATVNDSGHLIVSSSGVIRDTTVNSGGNVYISSGGTHTGSMNLTSTGRIYFYEGGVADLNLSGRTSASGVLISNMAQVQGTPSFTITVSGSQSFGSYKLAAGVSSFGKTITVQSETAGVLGTLSIGHNLTVGNKVYSLQLDDRILKLQIGTEANAPAEDTLLPYVLPHAEYMYGCIATSVGMLLGYYDLYGYTVDGIRYDLSNLIEGTISVDSRSSDGGSSYDMSDPSLLANFIASSDYVSRFYGKTPETERPYSFVNGDPDLGLNVSAWNCLADYLGTGQYWRGNSDLSTRFYYGTLGDMKNADYTLSITKNVSVPAKYVDFKYGLNLYTENRGYHLSDDGTRTVEKTKFSFDELMEEIDAGRPVLLSMRSETDGGHMVTAYGYNSSTREVIFDDTYRSNCRMEWDGTYEYSGGTYWTPSPRSSL